MSEIIREKGCDIIAPFFVDKDDFFTLLFVHFPNFPDLAGQIGTGGEGSLAGFPSRRGDFAGFHDVLEGFDLADDFLDLAPNFGGEHFHSPDIEIGVNEKASANIYAAFFVVDAVKFADSSALVAEHREGEAAIYHFGEFFLLPNFVREAAVGANGEYLNAEVFKIVLVGSNCCQFGRSDEGEVAGVETEQDPFSFKIGKGVILEAAFKIG